MPGVGIMQALTPFLAEACRQFSGEMFDAEKFSIAVSQMYDITIPRLAALGLAEQLSKEGLLTPVSGYATATAYRYNSQLGKPETLTTSPLTESEIESVINDFIKQCRSDSRLDHKIDALLEKAFLDRLLNLDSMRLLVRREASITAKKTPNTIVAKKTLELTLNASDGDELKLDFLVSQFLLDLRDQNTARFEMVSNIAFANMAAEAIACFREPPSATVALSGLTVYLDSPLLLDMLGVNADYADYGRELLEAIKKSGAKPAVFDHCIAEAEGAVDRQLAFVRSGINQVGAHWGTTAKPDFLSALSGRIESRTAERLGIDVQRDPEADLHRKAPKAVGSIESEMTRRMQAWRNEGAKDYDRKSVWALLAIRDTTALCARICDSSWLMLTRNTPLVSIANEAWATWLRGSTKHSDSSIARWAPISMSDKQFAGYLWARTGGGDGAISKARLLAHCSAAVRPRADVKARAYNLVLELSGSEAAEDVSALLEDREGARALMRATKGDPEDVTSERLPFILEQVKLAAGEFAAAAARKEAEFNLAEVRRTHELELKTAKSAHESTTFALSKATEAAGREQAQAAIEKQLILGQNKALHDALKQKAADEEMRRLNILNTAFAAGISRYIVLRWAAAIAFGLLSFAVAYVSMSEPKVAALLSAAVGILGFWFVPDLLDGPFSKYAMRRLVTVVKAKEDKLEMPLPAPDFRQKTWAGVSDVINKERE